MYISNILRNIIKKTKKNFEKRHGKGTKIFLKKKIKTDEKKTCGKYENISEEEKEKKRQYHRDGNKKLF